MGCCLSLFTGLKRSTCCGLRPNASPSNLLAEVLAWPASLKSRSLLDVVPFPLNQYEGRIILVALVLCAGDRHQERCLRSKNSPRAPGFGLAVLFVGTSLALQISAAARHVYRVPGTAPPTCSPRRSRSASCFMRSARCWFCTQTAEFSIVVAFFTFRRGASGDLKLPNPSDLPASRHARRHQPSAKSITPSPTRFKAAYRLFPSTRPLVIVGADPTLNDTDTTVASAARTSSIVGDLKPEYLSVHGIYDTAKRREPSSRQSEIYAHPARRTTFAGRWFELHLRELLLVARLFPQGLPSRPGGRARVLPC